MGRNRLILGRYPGESVTIGCDIVVSLVEICKGGWVKLSIEAPKDVGVWRKELVDRSPELVNYSHAKER